MFEFTDLNLPGLQGVGDDTFDDDSLDNAAFPEVYSIDNDGDGIPDSYVEDMDGDGLPDAIYTDTDGDGQIDSVQSTYGLDTDGDGLIDTIAVDTDSNLDGEPDSTQLFTDTDGDGIFDSYSEAFGIDTDGDAIVDSIHFATDQDMDGVFDVTGTIDGEGAITVNPLDDIIETQAEMDDIELIYDPVDSVLDVSNHPHYDSDSDPDDICGDPGSAAEVYHTQETNSSCAVAAQEFVLEQLTGREYTESELRDMAEDAGWYSPDGGTPMYDVGNILESQGLAVNQSTGNTLDSIADCLENGGAVIVGVDGGELYTGDNDFFAPGDGANHALQVTGIDRSDPDHPMVILNDSGVHNGDGVMVPAEDFVAAWEDSECFMVTAYPSI